MSDKHCPKCGREWRFLCKLANKAARLPKTETRMHIQQEGNDE